MQQSMNDPNCYSPPATSDREFTGSQLRFLISLAKFRRRPSVVRLFFAQWPSLLGNLIAASALAICPIILSLPIAFAYLTTAFAVGYMAAALGDLIGNCINRKRFWPVLDRIIDWKIVSELAPHVRELTPETASVENDQVT